MEQAVTAILLERAALHAEIAAWVWRSATTAPI